MFTAVRSNLMMSAITPSAPFTKAVVRAMKKLYPQELADDSWDNTGLLLEAPFNPVVRQKNTVLLTIDLTRAVADEAIALKSSIVIAYHPIIFRGLKSLTLVNSQQQTLLRLAAHGISVYSPHTAVDAAPGGLGDWLADIVTGTKFGNKKEASSSPSDSHLRPPLDRHSSSYQLAHHPTPGSSPAAHQFSDLKRAPLEHSRRPIVPQTPELESHKGAGMGRLVTFKEPQPLSTLLDLIGHGLNGPKAFSLAIPQDQSISSLHISSVAICAGSGGSLFANVNADLYFTGELGHHEALAIIEKGGVVVTLFHSNSERGYLGERMKGLLEGAVKEEWECVRKEGEEREELQYGEAWKEALKDESSKVVLSAVDRDPFGVVVLKEKEIGGEW